MRFSDFSDATGVANELQRRLSCTTSPSRRRKHMRAAANAIAALCGVTLQKPNLADDALEHAIPLSVLEDMRHTGRDDDAFDDRLSPVSSRTDNRNPAEYNYDEPVEFVLAVERDGYCKVQPPGMRESRLEPVRTRKVRLTPPGYFGLVAAATGYAVPVTLTDRPPSCPAPIPAVNRKGELIAPPAAILAEPQTAADAIEKLMASTLPRQPQTVLVHADDLLLGDSLPVGSCRRIAGCLYLRHSADVCEVVYR